MPESNGTLQDRMVAYSEKLESRRGAIERSTRQGAEFVVGLVSGKNIAGLVATISGAGESGVPEKQEFEVVSLTDSRAEEGRESVMKKAGSDVFDRLEEVFANKLIKEMVDIHVRRPIAYRAGLLAQLKSGDSIPGLEDHISDMLAHDKTNGEIRLTTEYRGITYKTKAGTDEVQFESRGNEMFAEAALEVLTDADTGKIDWESWEKILALVPSKLRAWFTGSESVVEFSGKTVRFPADDEAKHDS